MSQERDIQNLLWALKELGVVYDPTAKVFTVQNGNALFHLADPVRAAQTRQGYLRAMEIQNAVSFPELLTEFEIHVEENLLPALKSSNVQKWKAEFKEELDKFGFEMRKVNAR